jgi:3D-(3,5/4)-trihydroxycyclohexane-1,2-dione acylhydrolase (decyclizing)
MGAETEHVRTIAELEATLARAREAPGPFVAVIDTDPYPSTPHGGHWWEVAVPEVSDRAEVMKARAQYEAGLKERVG